MCCNYWFISIFPGSVPPREIYCSSWLCFVYPRTELEDAGGHSCERGILRSPLYSVSCKFLETKTHLIEDELFLAEDQRFDFSLIKLKFGCADVPRHNNTCIFHKRQIMESSRLAVTYFVLNTPCIFHDKKCFLPTSFVDVWTQRIRAGSSDVPPLRNLDGLPWNVVQILFSSGWIVIVRSPDLLSGVITWYELHFVQ